MLLRTAASADVVSSFGIPSALFSGSDGSLVREGWRQFGVAVQAWGKIVSDELSLKLEQHHHLIVPRARKHRHSGAGSGDGSPC